MRSLWKSVGLVVVAWVCSSCGTQVYLHKWQPAQVDLPRGTVLRVHPETRGPLHHELRRAFAQQIERDGLGQAQLLWDGDFSLKWEQATNTLNL